MHNAELKEKMKSLDVKQWEVAEFLEINEQSFSRKMRRELAPDILQAALHAVEVIAKRKAEKSVIAK